MSKVKWILIVFLAIAIVWFRQWADDRGESGFGASTTAEQIMALLGGEHVHNLTVAITGANSGIGYETAKIFAAHGANTYVIARTKQKAEETIGRINRESPHNKMETQAHVDAEEAALQREYDTACPETARAKYNVPPLICRRLKQALKDIRENPWNMIRHLSVRTLMRAFELDLANTTSIDAFGAQMEERHRVIDVLILNAGVMAVQDEERLDDYDGVESQMAINHLGHFRLVHRVLHSLQKTFAHRKRPARVIVVSSRAHRRGDAAFIDDERFASPDGYSPLRAYGNSKMANILFAYEFNRRYNRGPKPVLAVSLHPGVILTNLGRNMPWWQKILFLPFLPFMKSVGQGAATTMYTALDDSIDEKGGRYFANAHLERTDMEDILRNETAIELFWRRSEQLSGTGEWRDADSTARIVEQEEIARAAEVERLRKLPNPAHRGATRN